MHGSSSHPAETSKPNAREVKPFHTLEGSLGAAVSVSMLMKFFCMGFSPFLSG